MSTKPKRFVCPNDACQKGFTRADHLRRHMLNHGDGDYTCPRCRLHFKRPDLLDRHVARHRQKDEEAGGEGLGIVESRKRLWRDANGNIVRERPSHSYLRRQWLRMQSLDFAQQSAQMPMFMSCLNSPRSIDAERASPSRSKSGVDSAISQSLEAEAFPQNQGLIETALGFDMFEFMARSSWDFPADDLEMQVDAPLDEGPSQNTTTASYHEPFAPVTSLDWFIDPNATMMPNPEQSEFGNFSVTANLNPPPGQQNMSHERTNPSSGELFSMPPNTGSESMLVQSQHGQPLRRNSTDAVENQGKTSATLGIDTSTMRAPAPSELVPTLDSFWETGSSISALTSPGSTRDKEQERSEQIPRSQRDSSYSVSSPGSLPSRPDTHTPPLDDGSHQRILCLLHRAETRSTDESADTRRYQSLLSHAAMQNYLELFFSCFNASYPLLHLATFDPSRTETLLLAAVVLLGATFSDNSIETFADRMYDALRAEVFHRVAFSVTPELWMIQTVFLLECIGQRQHDTAFVFHGLLVNLIRRSECLTVQQPRVIDKPELLESNWRRAIGVELQKRVAFLCLFWDTQNAALFSQPLSLSTFEIRTALPCSRSAWEATSAEEWWKYASEESLLPFQSVLTAYLDLESGLKIPDLDAFPLLLVLNGLISIQCEMKHVDQMASGLMHQTGYLDTSKWREQLIAAYDAWKVDFDTYCLKMVSFDESHSRRAHFARFRTAANAVYHTAHITLNVDIVDLQIYAGARRSMGRRVTRADYIRAQGNVKEWAQARGSSPAVKAVWHAAHLLRDSVFNLETFDVQHTFFYPFRLYISTLICWAFHSLTVVDVTTAPRQQLAGERQDRSPATSAAARTNSDVSTRWQAETEMKVLVSSMTSVMPERLSRLLGKYSTSGLTTVMAERLSRIRWIVIQEGIKLLKDLVPERMADEYEGVADE
ncbi:Fungal specific transcription factor domain-containing protein [Cladophialophora immunda]|nr:Fungal specific transcription factor domain-containing protein [Cladophialophora immunda]